MLTATELHTVHNYQLSNNLKNESAAIGMILITYTRLQSVISKLEAEAWKDREGKKKVGTVTKHTIAADAKKSIGSKVLSAKNISDIRKPGERA